jgi:hypothetical protein
MRDSCSWLPISSYRSHLPANELSAAGMVCSLSDSTQRLLKTGAPGEIRTPDPLVRSRSSLCLFNDLERYDVPPSSSIYQGLALYAELVFSQLFSRFWMDQIRKPLGMIPVVCI